ncbi:MAG: acyl-CoA dehydrogenase, partial [Microbacteriaceae bacterium]
SEWVWGGLNGNANVGTSTFEVNQNTTLTTDPLAWTDKETNPGDPLLFSAGSLVMTPGDKIFAPVALQTTSTSIAGTAKLQAAVAAAAPITQNDTGGLLWAAIDQRVVTSNTAFTCDATAFTTLTPFAVGKLGVALESGAGRVLAAASGSTQYYCFELSLPSNAPDTLQGRTIAPAWEFISVSN